MGIFDLFKPDLGKLKAKKNIKGLTKVLQYGDLHMREAAAIALGDIGDTRAVEPLIQVLRGTDWQIWKEVVWALGEIGDARAVKPLIRVIKDDAWDALEKALRKEEQLKYQKMKNATQVILSAGLGTADRLGMVLVKAEFQFEAEKALGKIRDPKATEPLIEALKDRDGRVQEAAKEALERIQTDKTK